MNQDRRAKIEKLIDQVQTAAFEMREFYNELTSLQEEEQEAFDNLPEGLQQAERGQQMEAIASALEDALGNLDSAIDDVETNSEEILSALGDVEIEWIDPSSNDEECEIVAIQIVTPLGSIRLD